MLKHGILGLLNYGDMTGYEIRAAFRDSQDGKPDKNILSITETGKEELKNWLNDDSVVSPIRSAMLMKTFFRGECSIDENIAFFKNLPKRESVFPTGSEEAGEVSGEYKKMIEDPLKALYWKFTIDFGVMYDRMLKEWCDNCINELEELKK